MNPVANNERLGERAWKHDASLNLNIDMIHIGQKKYTFNLLYCARNIKFSLIQLYKTNMKALKDVVYHNLCIISE